MMEESEEKAQVGKRSEGKGFVDLVRGDKLADRYS